MSPDEPSPADTLDNKDPTTTEGNKWKIGKSLKPLNIETIVEDWKHIGEKFKELNKKISENVLHNVERLENIHYENMKTADAIKQKIEQDWHTFHDEVQNGIERIKKANQQNSERMVEDLNAKKAEIQQKMKTWEKNYQDWSVKTEKKVKETLSAWGRFGWKLYFTFLLVSIPIVIMIILVLNAVNGQ